MRTKREIKPVLNELTSGAWVDMYRGYVVRSNINKTRIARVYSHNLGRRIRKFCGYELPPELATEWLYINHSRKSFRRRK